MASHSWEAPARVRAWEMLRAADNDLDSENVWGECSDDSEGEEVPMTPGLHLVELLLEHFLYSRLSAKHVCTLMFWAEKAGIGEASHIH